MTPLFENILVKRDAPKDTNNDWETVVKQDNVLTGIVIAAGPGTPEWPDMQCAVGDHIRWHRNAGESVNYNGEKHLILNERKREIIAKL